MAASVPSLAAPGPGQRAADFRGHDSAAQADRLLRRSFPDQLKALGRDPGLRPPEIERFYSDTTALLAKSGSSSSALQGRLGLAERLPKPGRLLVSAVPLRVGPDSDKEVLDTRLRRANGAFEPAAPLVPVSLPARVGGPASLQGGSERVEIQLGGLTRPGARARRTGAGALIYPNAITDADAILASRSTGLELLWQLRSRAAPEDFTMELGLPEGAELRPAAGGGAEVVRDGEPIAGIAAPSAVDAAGEEVPVAMKVERRSVVMRIPHRDSGVRYPALLDPLVFGYAWETGASGANLEDWELSTSPGSPFQTATTCQSPPGGCYGAPANDHGLYLYAPPNQSYETGQFARASFTVPRFEDDLANYGSRPSTYINSANLNLIDYHRRTDTAADPAATLSLWSEQAPQITAQQALAADVTNFNAPTLQAATQANRERTKRVQLELAQTGAASTLTDWRDLYLGGAGVVLDDKEAPSLAPVQFTNRPTGWTDDVSYEATPTATDPGLGIKQFFYSQGRGQDFHGEQSIHPCTGQPRPDLWCPRQWSETHVFSTTELGEGVSQGGLGATDALGKGALSPGWLLHIDRSAPQLALSGPLTDPGIAGFDLHVDATDGAYNGDPDDQGNWPAARSGVRSIEILVDGERDFFETQPCDQDGFGSCPMARDWSFNPAKWGSDSEHEVTVIVTDQVGHRTTETVPVRLLDDIATKPSGWMDERTAETTVWARNPTPEGQEPPPAPQRGVGKITLTLPGGQVLERDFGCSPAGPCEEERSAKFTYETAALPEGIHTVIARGYRPDGTEFRTWETELRIDHSDPEHGVVARNGGITNFVEEGEDVVFLTAVGNSIDVSATDEEEDSARSGVQSIEIRIDGRRVFHDTQTCDTHSCPMNRSYSFDSDDYAALVPHPVQVITTDYAASDDPAVEPPPPGQNPTDNTGVRYRSTVRNFQFTTATGSTPAAANGSQLGLEDYFHYDPTPTGAGGTLQTNLATGNLLWHKVPIVNPGRGLSTFLNLTYNSFGGPQNSTAMATGNHDDLGLGFSAGISGLTRINEPLGGVASAVPLPAPPTITLTDPDGTRHLFRLRDDLNSYEPPPGVNLELRRFQGFTLDGETAPRSWGITRPDGVTYFFDGWGYARSIVDRNGNEIRFEYQKLNPSNGSTCPAGAGQAITPLLCEPRLVRVIDPAGNDPEASPELKDARTLKVEYHPGSPTAPGQAGKISRILDHGSRATDFFYNAQGRLIQMLEARGADVRGTNFTYDGAGRLASVSDGLNQQTKVVYAGNAVGETIDRRNNHKSYAFGLPTGQGAALTSRVTDARGYSTLFDFDGGRRPMRITDARGTKTELEWDADSNVSRITRAAGTTEAAQTTMGYDANGMLTFQRDALGRLTLLGYRRSAGTILSPTGTDSGGQFVSDLDLMRRPAANTWTFELDGGTSTPLEFRGNVTAQIDPLGGRAETTYGPRGEILSERDQVGNLTTYPLSDYDPNGLPQVKIDPRGNDSIADGSSGRWVYGFDARGNLTRVTDPRHSVAGGPGAQPPNGTTHIFYDNLDRPLVESTPKDPAGAPGVFVGHRRFYDRNDNVVRVRDAHSRDLVMTYSPTDELLTQQNAKGEITRHQYDPVGNPIETRLPRGNITRFALDEIGRTVVEQRLGIDDADLLTSYAYDRRDNLVGMEDPNGNAGGDPASAQARAQNVALRRFTYAYDLADNRRFEIENADAAGKFISEHRYDANDNRIEVTDPRGLASGAERGDFTTRYRYDGRDELAEIEDPFGGVTSYERRADGMVTAETSPNGNASSLGGDYTVDYTYFPTGEIKTRSLPWRDRQYDWENSELDQLKVSYERDPVGNPAEITDARGNSFDNTFLHTGELKTTGRPSWWTLDYSAGPNELTAEMAGPSGAGTMGVPSGGDRFGATGGGAQADTEIALGGPRIVERSGYEREQGGGGAGGEDPSQPASPTDFGRVEAEPLPSMLPDAGATRFEYDNEMRLLNVFDADNKQRGFFYDQIGRTAVKYWSFKQNADLIQSYGYDRNGNLTSFADGSGAGWSWGYDEFDRTTTEEAPGATSSPSGDLLAEVSKYSYDPNGNLTRRITPRGPAFDFLFNYDGADRLTREENPATEAWSYKYDLAGNRTEERSPRGILQESDYDALNRVTEMTDLAGGTSTYDYDANGNRTRIETPGAGPDPDADEVRRLTTIEYDGRNLPWKTFSGGADGVMGLPSDARTTITEYDPNGNLVRTVNPEGIASGEYEPEYRSALGGASDAAKNATVNVYNSDDLLVERHLPWDAGDFQGERRFRQSFERDPRGRIFALRAPHQAGLPNERVPTTCYTHFETGWTKTSSDERRMPAEACAGAGKLFSYDYDARGNQTRWDTAHGQADPNSRRVVRSFFPNGTLRQRRAIKTIDGTDNAARVYNYYYNANRSLALFFDQDNSRNTHITRDGAERELAVNEQWGAGRDTLYTYDGSGNVASVRTDGTWTGGTGYSGGKTTAFAYDDAERETLMTVTGGQGPGPRTTQTSYWPSHEVKTKTRSHGADEGYGHNAHGEIAHLDRDPGPNTDYGYDRNGNRLSDERGNHTYNSRDQLTAWDRRPGQPNADPDGGDASDRTEYFLGGSGQTKRTEDHGTSETTVFTYTDGSDRLDETVTTEPGEPTLTTAYDYNAFDSVRTITATAPGEQTTTTTYVYDEFERRVRAKGTGATDPTEYCYDGLDRRDTRAEPPTDPESPCESGTERHEYSYVGTTESLSREQRVGGGNLRNYDYDSQGRRQGQVREGSYRAYRKDANGSVIALEDSSGTAIADSSYEYDPYGELACPESQADDAGCEEPLSEAAEQNPFRFQGFYYDSGVKTYDMLARDYRPDVGRFNTADRFESASADLELQSDPLTQNRYAFAGGNPVNNVEFDGHTTNSIFGPCWLCHPGEGGHPDPRNPKRPVADAPFTGPAPPAGSPARSRLVRAGAYVPPPPRAAQGSPPPIPASLLQKGVPSLAPSDADWLWHDLKGYRERYGDAQPVAFELDIGDFDVETGTFRFGAFIEAEDAGLGFLKLAGDDRGFSRSFKASESRATFHLDFETGKMRVIISPSCNAGGGDCASALDRGNGNKVLTHHEGKGKTLKVEYSLKPSKGRILGQAPSITGWLEFNTHPAGFTFEERADAFPSREAFYFQSGRPPTTVYQRRNQPGGFFHLTGGPWGSGGR